MLRESAWRCLVTTAYEMILCNKLQQLPEMATTCSSPGSYFGLHAEHKLIGMPVYCSISLVETSLWLTILLNIQTSQPSFVACGRWGAKLEASWKCNQCPPAARLMSTTFCNDLNGILVASLCAVRAVFVTKVTSCPDDHMLCLIDFDCLCAICFKNWIS